MSVRESGDWRTVGTEMEVAWVFCVGEGIAEAVNGGIKVLMDMVASCRVKAKPQAGHMGWL